jgi:hypothetical protein
VICGVQPPHETFSAFLFGQITGLFGAVPFRGGALAIVTNVGTGCGGRRPRRHVLDVHGRTARLADGEVVWFGRPDAGVKLAMMLRITPMTVTTKPGRRGEHEGNR